MKRFDCVMGRVRDGFVPEMEESADGDYVLYSDVEILIEALKKAKNEYWNKCYEGSGKIVSLSVHEFDQFIDEALHKVGGE